jgi:hypothetical protein
MIGFEVDLNAAQTYVRPALGRLDPRTQQGLFTVETKVAWTNCKAKCRAPASPSFDWKCMMSSYPIQTRRMGLRNAYPASRGIMSRVIPSAISALANCECEPTADNLNLTGTARHNMSIRVQANAGWFSLNFNENTVIACNDKRCQQHGRIVPYCNPQTCLGESTQQQRQNCKYHLPT